MAGCDRGDPFLAWTLAALSNDGYVAGSGDVYELTAAGRHWATIGGSAPGPAGPFWRLRTKKDVVVSGVEPAVPVHSIRNDGAVLAYYPRVDGDVAALPLTLFADGDYTPEDDDFPGVTYLEVT